MSILSIDPGNVESGWCVIDEDTMKPLEFGKTENTMLRDDIAWLINEHDVTAVVIEMIASYGMAVGKTVFDTCVWIGRFSETAEMSGCRVNYIYRKDEKLNICGNIRAKDSNIRRALIDRFAEHDLKNGKGTKSKSDWFYGFKADIWAAYAVGVTWLDMQDSYSRISNTLKSNSG